MTGYKPKKVQSVLLRKGFAQKNSHHTYFHYMYNNKKTTIHTFMSNGANEIDNYLKDKMAKQLKLSKTQFENLIECSLSQEKLLEYYLKEGLVGP